MSPWLWPLLPLELVYHAVVLLRLLAYQQGWLQRHQPTVPVISIGNLTTGGTGKTPIVIEIARGLIRAGKAVFQVEYLLPTAAFCRKAERLRFSSMRKRLLLDDWRDECW